MVNLQVKPVVQTPGDVVLNVPERATLEQELDAMVDSINSLDPSQPDIIMAATMAYMGRCTEMYLKLVRIEGNNRQARFVRTMQLQKVMDLLDFQFKGASRLIEVRRQEVELSKS